jgi:hypothetical protein
MSLKQSEENSAANPMSNYQFGFLSITNVLAPAYSI